MKRINLYIILFAFSLSACEATEIEHVKTKKETPKLTLESYLNSHFEKRSSDIEAVLVLSEGSGCIPCSKKYAVLLEQFLNDPKSLLIITASGISVDISPFLKGSNNNVFIDDRNEFAELDLLEASGAIFIDKNKVDTIISIDAKTLDSQFEYITSRL